MFRRSPSYTSERASVIPLGFLIILAMGVAAFTVYQVNYAPQIGLDSEIDSNRNLLSDAREFDFAVRSVVTTGASQPVHFGSSISYPLVFPPTVPPKYVISTTETETATFGNFSCSRGDCDSEFSTTSVIMLGQYNYLENARVYGYEYGVVYSAPNATAEGSPRVVTYNDPSFIDGTNILLISFSGNFSHERANTAFTSIVPENAEQYEYVIQDDGTNSVTLELPTEMGEHRWESLLESEMVENGGHITDISYRNFTVVKEGGDHPGDKKKNHDHWQNCDHSGKGKPFVTCTIDNSTNYVTITLEQGEEYTVTTRAVELTG